MDSPLIAALRRAVDAAPDDIALRVHLAEMLRDTGETAAAVGQAAAALQRDPANAQAQQLMADLLGGAGPAGPGQATAPPAPGTPLADFPPPTGSPSPANPPSAAGAPSPASSDGPPDQHPAGRPDASHPSSSRDFDWHEAERQLAGSMPASLQYELARADGVDIERPVIRLADVGGMEDIKRRLYASFLAPMTNPKLREAYGKSLRGGLLLYGPPGCGKTFLAKAVAGELGAGFITASAADVLDTYIGQSERNVHDLFQAARRAAPCVLFLDEIDALGQRRSQNRSSLLRGMANQLLTELDGVATDNEGIFVLGATNQPWDVDPALRRPGRLDRTLLVLPPDGPARQAIFSLHLRGRPVATLDPSALARGTDGYTGADIALVCEQAVEDAMMESATTGQIKDITTADLLRAADQVHPSIGPWLESARTYVSFGEDDGTHGELRAFLKRAKRL